MPIPIIDRFLNRNKAKQEQETALKQQKMYADAMTGAAAVGAPVAFRGNVDPQTTRWLLDFQQDLGRIMHQCQGQIQNSEGQWVSNMNSNGDAISAMINSMGAARLETLMNGLVNRNTFMTKLDDEAIRDRMFFLTLNMLAWFFIYHREWEVKPGNASIMVNMLCDIVENALKRAEGGEERSGHMATRQVHELATHGGTEEKPKTLFGG